MARPSKATPEIIEQVREVYETTAGKGGVSALAKKLGVSRCSITRYAMDNGFIKANMKPSPKWKEDEIRLLRKYARYTPKTIKNKLSKAGYNRTRNAIVWRLKECRFRSNLKGQSACQVAECFGVAVKTVISWINKGYLKAERRGTARENDSWYITNKNIVDFIKRCVDIIDLRKVDKYWFIDLAFGGYNGLSPLSLDESIGEGDDYLGSGI